ncbi:acetamidase/formamidase family protein [Niallia sp. NCCP-28]|uniref:acetamidase/formamidase family protein n=1 Tax=Niallia sp. NCCP-28 TaxID=2934712 RepID=UPI00208B4799|nr:acetamidase/formamidase family protein [Niallia sp. NCCP-28]GKU81949.1 acetamidase [Niallia sp. NCCP-28]
MKQIVNREHYIYGMSAQYKPVLSVESGDHVEFQTYDCFLNQITSSNTEYSSIDWSQINPATGPVYIEDAEPGDILAVHIKKIELEEKGVMATGPNLGVMGHRISEFSVKEIYIKDNQAIFNEQVRIPLNPMIGVIGVAPKEGEISCGTPGDHGGNMDTILITDDATLYFPVFHQGALFSLGDVHAAMGDGEVGVSGVEIPAKVTVAFSVIKGSSIRTPIVKNKEGIAYLVSKETLDEAVNVAVEEMVDLICERSTLSLEDATMLLSAAGQVQVSQVVDPLKTARCFISKDILTQLGIHELF